MNLEKEFKIRRLLGDDFHLNVELKENGETNWSLYRYYEDKSLYYDRNNKPIMTSEDSTEKDLLKFARKNHIYDFEGLHTKKGLYISIALLVLCIINVFIKSKFLYGMFYGTTIYLWIDLILNWVVGDHNFKINMNLLKDESKLIMQRCGYREDFDWETRFDLKTQVGDYKVSTVDLGIDHNLGIGKSLYYETMIFSDNKDNPFDSYQERYATEKEARKGHKKAIAYVEQKLKEIKE